MNNEKETRKTGMASFLEETESNHTTLPSYLYKTQEAGEKKKEERERAPGVHIVSR